MIRISKRTWKVVGTKLNTLSYTICNRKTKRKGRTWEGKGKKGKFWKRKNLGTKNHLKYVQIWNPMVRSSQPSFKTLTRNNVERPWNQSDST